MAHCLAWTQSHCPHPAQLALIRHKFVISLVTSLKFANKQEKTLCYTNPEKNIFQLGIAKYEWSKFRTFLCSIQYFRCHYPTLVFFVLLIRYWLSWYARCTVDCLSPNCSGHGVCVAGDCLCYADYHGSDCSLQVVLPDGNCSLVCARDCSQHGVFDFAKQTCLCQWGWTGRNCQTGSFVDLL